MTWAIILDHLVSALVPLVLSIALVLLRNFLKRKGLESAQTVLDDVVTRSAHFAEQEAHKALKANGKLEGHEKMDAALSFAEQEIKRLGLDQMAEEELVRVIEAKLPVVRATLPATPTADPVSDPVAVDPEAPKA